ncbi:3-hydroxyacyl-CoA dehydrogenase family protein [Cytobacillus sp. IB215665]|uniref:3-hydroxyacyl-CoA dehydrogenase family protein n=1 Tax=Cytobacillus sp. IB215665 TaxID=3097357 RepID=UPI002A0E33E6|nr:3-hydroxyacyl-CoA dehydrogenase family protein [Cytobacillus sp. IB215665]MDX8366203.1 3-hydroxyacyl-CoA dehydrogenase family protein [Cytobacillus sp. IB215665]
MNIQDVKNICVVGSGQMGHQIGMLCALGGFATTIQDVNSQSLTKAKTSLESIMEQWVMKGKIAEDQKEAALKRLSFTESLEEASSKADFVIEAIVEKLEIKREVFKKLDEYTPPHAILATNSSTIVNSLIAGATKRPEKVCNMHFFFPPLVMDCVEVVMSEQTSEETAQITLDVCEKINRKGILLRKEISGFVANRILIALQKEAMYLYEQGIADYKDIDLIVKQALKHPIGPFELMDLSGLDVGYYVMQQRFAETGNPKDKPPAFIEERVKAGLLGRKTGKGFYDYSSKKVKQ